MHVLVAGLRASARKSGLRGPAGSLSYGATATLATAFVLGLIGVGL
jgi:hypothetical protein